MSKQAGIRLLAAVGLLLAATVGAQAASITVSATAPTVDGADVAMLNTTGAFDIGGDQGHIWSNRPAQGQAFLTGNNPSGYELSAVTLQSRQTQNHGGVFRTRVGSISGNAFTEIANEDFTKVAYSANDYLTTTFASPITLSPNTLYGFDWGSDNGGFITNNNDDANFAGGAAYSSGSGGSGGATVTLHAGAGTGKGDRVFHADLSAIPGPPPAAESVPTGQSVGVNFGANRSGASLAAGQSAGVVPQANWNNAPNASGSIADAADQSGAATGMAVGWSTNESWSHGTTPPTGDGVLLKGWVSANNGNSASTISLDDIPYDLYDLYLYVSHDRSNDDTRFNEASVDAITDFVTLETEDGTTIGADPFVFKEIMASGLAGNYVKFSDLTQSSLSLEFLPHNASSDRGPLSGLQIVEKSPGAVDDIPEPATMALCGLAVCGLGGYVRRRRKA